MPEVQIKLKSKPVYELLCMSDFKSRCTLILKLLNRFLIVFDMVNDQKILLYTLLFLRVVTLTKQKAREGALNNRAVGKSACRQKGCFG